MAHTSLSFDVEEWFHLLELDCVRDSKSWDAFEMRSKLIVPKILRILNDNDAKATFFVLGWLAEREPRLVEMIVDEGHEVASHGYGHQLLTDIGEEGFRRDLEKSLAILTAITGKEVLGYRAPGFSVTKDTSWAFDVMIEFGLEYDASVFPAYRNHGFIQNSPLEPYVVNREKGDIVEFPQSVVDMDFLKFSVFGGGYLRLSPGLIVEYFTRLLLKRRNFASFYLHPRDMDVDQPKLEMSFLRSLRSYINIGKTEKKLERLTKAFEMKSYQSILRDESMNLFVYSDVVQTISA